jgi:hypothetical protein
MLDVEAQLWRARADLVAVLERSSAGGADTTPIVRAVASILTSSAPRIEALAAAGAPASVVDALRELHATGLASALATLRISVRDDAGHRIGAAEIVDILGPLEAMAAELASAADLPLTPLARPSDTAPDPSPSP